jgi:thiamine transport system substrate-binding protein
MKKTLVSLVLIVIATSGCLQFGPAHPGADCPPAPEPSVARGARFDGQQLRILDQGAFPAAAKLKPLFENLTGATIVTIGGGDAGSALQQALLGAGNPPADVLYGVDNALFFTEEVRASCLFVPYESPNLANIDEATVGVDQFRVDGDLWATPVDHGYINVNYNVALRNQSRTPPQDLRDLASSQWASSFVTEDPRESSPGLGFLLATIDTFGESGGYTWKDYWTELLKNGGLVVKDWSTAYVYHYSGGYGTYDPANKGDRSIVTSYTTSPAVEVYFGASSPPGVSLEPPYGSFHQLETMAILRGTDKVDLARAWIDFCLTHAFQDMTAPELAVYPVITGVTLPDAFTQYATDPHDLKPARMDAQKIGSNLDRWLEEWEDLYQAAQS